MQINNNFQKNANMSMAARLLWRYPGISRIDIAKKLGVYRSTISNIINALVETGVVLESRKENCSSLGGRKPLQLELNPDFGCVAGIELQPSGILP
jgi:DNA-binding transcriptional regulator LsrR (DeoR family)